MNSRRLLALLLLLGLSLAGWKLALVRAPARKPVAPETTLGPETGAGSSPRSLPPPPSAGRRSLPPAVSATSESPSAERPVTILEGGPPATDTNAADAALRRRAAAAYRTLISGIDVTAEQDARMRKVLADAEDNWTAGLDAWTKDRDEALRSLAAGTTPESELAARLDDNGDVLFERLARDTEAALEAEAGTPHHERIRRFVDEHLRAIVETKPFERR